MPRAKGIAIAVGIVVMVTSVFAGDGRLMNAQEAQTNRFNGTVAIFYNPIAQIDTREWDSIKEFNGPYHPLIKDYTTEDLEVLRKQLHWIRRAGVDVLIYDAYGYKTRNIADLPKDKTLRLLVNELSNQDKEARKLQLGIYMEKWFSNPTVEECQFGLDYVRTNLANLDFYYRYKGAPLVMLYGDGQKDAFDPIVKANPFFRLQRCRPFKTDFWSYVEGYPQTLNRDWMPVSPGFDGYMEGNYTAKYVHKVKDINLDAIRQHGPQAAAQREDGLVFERQLLRARGENPGIIFISGWNDWQCCLQIEPAVEYEFTYVDMAARLLGRGAETLPYRHP